MIQINLLQEVSAKKSGGKSLVSQPRGGGGGGGGNLLLWLAILAVLFVDGSIGVIAYSQVGSAKAKLDTVKADYDALNKKITARYAAAESVRQFHEVVSNQMDVLKTLDPPDRLLWSEKINMLANLIPSEVFLTSIEVKENVIMVETEQSKLARIRWEADKKKKAPKAPEAVKKPVIHYILTLSGLAMGEDSNRQLKSVLSYQRALNAYSTKDSHGVMRRFMDGFEPVIEFGPINATIFEGTPVSEFSFNLTTKSMGQDEPKDSSKAEKQVASN